MLKKIIAIVLIVLFTAMLLIGIIYLKGISKDINQLKGSKTTWDNEDKRRYANTLLAKGLNKEAAIAFEDYIETSKDSKEILAGLCYQLGGIYMDLFEYEKALRSFYKAEALNPNSEFKEEINKKIIEALENLGLTSQAQYELTARTSLTGLEKQEGRVIARIGKREIMDTEVNKAWESLPDMAKKQFEGEKDKEEFVRQYVAAEVLYDKAKRLGYDRIPPVREIVDMVKKQYSVQFLIQKAVRDSIQISAKDLENFYEDNKEKYIDQDAVKVQYTTFKDSKEENLALTRLKNSQGTKVKDWIQLGATAIVGLGDIKDIVDDLLKEQKGTFTKPYKIDDQMVIFFIEDKRPGRQKLFSEVRSQVEYEYIAGKQQEITQTYLKNALEEQEVEFFFNSNDNTQKK